MLLYLAGPLVVAMLAPLAIIRGIAPYPVIFLIGTIPVVFFFTAIVAVPMYLAIPKRLRTNIAWMIGIAFLAGFFSYVLFNLALHGSYEQVGNVVLIEDNRRTAEGWKVLLSQAIWMGGLSVPGGLLFCLGARSERLEPREA